MNKERLKRMGIIPSILQLTAPSYGCCEICGIPWKYTKSHDVDVTETESFFAICEYCNEHSSMEEKEKAYYNLWNNVWHGHMNNFTFYQYITAVLKDVGDSRTETIQTKQQ